MVCVCVSPNYFSHFLIQSGPCKHRKRIYYGKFIKIQRSTNIAPKMEFQKTHLLWKVYHTKIISIFYILYLGRKISNQLLNMNFFTTIWTSSSPWINIIQRIEYSKPRTRPKSWIFNKLDINLYIEYIIFKILEKLTYREYLLYCTLYSILQILQQAENHEAIKRYQID